MTAGLRKAVVGGLVLLGASAPAAAAPTTATITGPGVIRVTDRQTDYHWVDGGTPGPGAGDIEILRVQLYNQRVRERPIGHADLVCTFTDASARNCTGTYFLPKGKIMVGGVIGSRLIFEVAVLGGTGLYQNARGTLTVTAAAQHPRRNFLLFRLVA
jgi:hypothetical protein